MRFNPNFICGTASLFLSSMIYADNAAIVDANNLAAINFLLGHQNTIFTDTTSGSTLANLEGTPYGLNLSITKTFARFFTAVALEATSANLAYNNSGFGLSNNAASFVQSINARFGYSFYPTGIIGITPYLTLGYQHAQLDTGGMPNFGTYEGGITQISMAGQYGIGILSQWAATPKWVLSVDAMLGDNFHSWIYATVPIDFDYSREQATLAAHSYWQLALKSDYKINSNLHGQLGVQYSSSGTSSGTSSPDNLLIPSQQNNVWQINAGLGLELDHLKPDFSSTTSNKAAALIEANNQVKLLFGYIFQNYGEIAPGKPGYSDRQEGNIPVLGMAFSKTWKNIYAEVGLAEAIGDSLYVGSDVFTGAPLTGSTRNTMTDVFGRLGYQIIFSKYASLTPYGIAGYHRWLRSISYPETYHNNWEGLGALLQVAPISKLVLSIDSNAGRTSNAQVHTWNTFYVDTLLFGTSLRSRTYFMASAGADYQIVKDWHLLANLNYWRFNYGMSNPNQFGVYEPASDTRLLTATVGVGYSLG